MGGFGYGFGAGFGAGFGSLAPPFAPRLARANYVTSAGEPMPSTYCVGDLEPDILFPLTETALTTAGIRPVDLTDATAVTVRWRRPDGSLVTRTGASGVSVEDALLGHVRLTWQAGDTAQLGGHRAQVQVTWANGEVQTFPSDGGAFEWRVNPLV